jgi:hypothetical protein
MLNRIPQKILAEYYQRAKATKAGASDTVYNSAKQVA